MKDVFFYGLFMDDSYLRSKGVGVRRPRKAVLPGYALRVAQRGLLVPQFGAQAFGMVFTVSDAEIDRLYAELGLHIYRPLSVLLLCEDGAYAPALTFNPGDEHAGEGVNAEYLSKLRALHGKLGLPSDLTREPATG
jgi:hypothetical protein